MGRSGVGNPFREAHHGFSSRIRAHIFSLMTGRYSFQRETVEEIRSKVTMCFSPARSFDSLTVADNCLHPGAQSGLDGIRHRGKMFISQGSLNAGSRRGRVLDKIARRGYPPNCGRAVAMLRGRVRKNPESILYERRHHGSIPSWPGHGRTDLRFEECADNKFGSRDPRSMARRPLRTVCVFAGWQTCVFAPGLNLNSVIFPAHFPKER